MSINRLKTGNIFLLSLLVLFSLTACSSNLSHPNSHGVLELDSTNFAKYWVAKDKLIDWQNSLSRELQNNSNESTTQYKASFVVDSSGQMTQLKIINSVTGELIEQASLAEILEQEFYPTTQNHAQQAVRINTSFRL